MAKRETGPAAMNVANAVDGQRMRKSTGHQQHQQSPVADATASTGCHETSKEPQMDSNKGMGESYLTVLTRLTGELMSL